MAVIDRTKLDEFTVAYIQAMLWTSSVGSTIDEDGEESEFDDSSLSDDYWIEDIEESSLAKIIADCTKFQEENWDDLCAIPDAYCSSDSFGRSHYTGLECAGHDYWLTRNGHGTGFWDRDYDKDLRDRLTAACKYHEVYCYVGDDGKVYVD